MVNLLLAFPIFSHVEPKPFGHFVAMAIAGGAALKDRASISVDVTSRSALVPAMNDWGHAVLARGFDALVVCDDDCLIPTDALVKLVDHLEAGRDFVSSVGFMRGFPHTTTVGRYYPEGYSVVPNEFEPTGFELRGYGWLDDLTGAPPLLEADFCGVPIALISRRAFAVTAQPWFDLTLNGGGCTHDVFWAERLKAAGIPVLVDTTIVCGHLADAPVITPASRARVRDAYRHAVQRDAVSA